MDTDALGRRLELMRAGVQSRVARLAGVTGERARRLSPPVLLGVLCSGAFAPLVMSGLGSAALLTAGTGAVASVGGNVLTDIVKAGVQRLGGRDGEGEGFSPEDVEAELARQIERVLEAGGSEAESLRSEIALVLEEIGAVGAAVETAIHSGDEALLQRLTEGLAEVGREFNEFGFVLADVRAQLMLLRDEMDQQSGQVRLAVDLLYRQATTTRMLLDQMSRIDTLARGVAEGDGGPPEPKWRGCPYQGLPPFDEDEQEVFYGRERVTAQLMTAVSQRLTAPGLVVVTGASGAGKSSLLSAGLLPAIGRGELRESAREWPRQLIKGPGGRPLERLASVLGPMAGLDAPAVHASLAAAPERAHLLIRQAVESDAQRRGLSSGAAGECRLMLVVDQFEELFTASGDTGEQTGAGDGQDAGEVAGFITALHAAATLPSGPAATPAALVVIAVRGDFIDRCSAHPILAGALAGGQFVLGPMNESDLRLTITGPAAAAGLELEAGLTDAIMTELASSASGTSPGALPLVSQTMRTVWEEREGKTLTLRGYAKTGGVTEAVATSANSAYASLPTLARHTARRILVQLTVVTPSGQLARRTATRTELLRAAGDPDPAVLEQVVNVFAAARIITVDAGTIQISHDVLLQAWPQLRGWLHSDLENHALRAQLLQDAEEWERKGHSSSYLYRGPRLAAVQDARAHWESDTGRYPALPATPAAFLAASRATNTRGIRIRQAAVAALSLLVVIAVTFASLATRAQHNATNQRNAAVSRQLITQSQLLLTTDPALASRLAAAAWRIKQGPEARANLLNVLAQPNRVALTGHTGSVTAVAFSPDGRTLATGSDDMTVRLWDASTHHQIGAPITGHTGPVNTVAFSPDGRTLATGSDDMTVRLWDASTHHQIGAPITGRTAAVVTSMAFSPDGRTLASGDEDGRVRLWDITTHHQISASLIGSGSGVSSVAFSPDGRTLATGHVGGMVLWDVATHRAIGGAYLGATHAVNSVVFSPDGRTLASGSDDMTVRLWDVATRHQIGTPLTGHTGNVTSVVFSPDGRTLAAGSMDDTARLWDVATRHQIGTPLTGHTNWVSSVVFSPDGRTLASGSDDMTVRLWDVATHHQVGAPLTGHTGPVSSVVFSPNGRTLASSGSTDGMIRLWDVTTHQQIGAPLADHTSVVASVAFSPNGRTLASGSTDGTIRLWDVATHHQVGAPLTGHTGNVSSVVFSPDGRTLASSSHDMTVRLWDVTSRHQIGTPLTGHTGLVMSVVFSPNGRTLASGSDDMTVRLWDVATRHQIGTPLTGHTGNVTSVVFSPDGRTLASGSTDGTIRLWDVTTRHQIGAPLTGHTSPVSSMAFSPNGRTLAATEEDLTIRLWDVAIPNDLVSSVCTIAGRSLTPEEWARYVPPGPKFRKACP